MGKKKKKASKALRTPEKPITINILIDGRALCGSPLNKAKEALNRAVSEIGKNPLSY